MGKVELWAAVVASYDAEGLLQLTNVRDRSATGINTAKGQDAAQAVIDLWPIYAQSNYNEANLGNLEVAKRAVIAMLWSRGGSSASIAKVEWDSVFSEGGLIAKVRQTGARGRQGPSSSSGVSTRDETVQGQHVMGWSDRASTPPAMLPRRRLANGYEDEGY